MRRVTRQAQEWVQKQARDNADLARRFEALQLDTVLAPEKLVTKAGREDGKAKVAAWRRLIAQQAASGQADLDFFEKLIASVRSEKDRRDMRAGLQDALPHSKQLSDETMRAQYATADAMEHILDWCSAHASALRVENQQLAASTQQQADELYAAYTRLNDSIERERAAEAKAEALHADGRARIDEAARRALVACLNRPPI